jgi:ferric-dicitrate binding protein FerR (iron transport regulator)
MSDERLHAYLDDELTAAERSDFEHELARDPALRARLQELRGLDAELRDLYATHARSAEPALVRLRLPADARSTRLPWLLVPLAAAAGLVAGLFLRSPREPAPLQSPSAATFAAVATLATGPFLVDDGGGTPREVQAGEFLAPGTRVSAPPGVRLALVLRDGSELRLDRESSLRLLGDRRVELGAGRAWSHVVPGTPFRFECGSAAVLVHGTELTLERQGERTAVQLLSGSAELQAGGGARALAAGQSAVWENGALSEARRIESEALATGWMLELYAYSGTHQKDLAEHLDRLLVEMGHRKVVSFEERVLTTELAGVCRVPIARYLVSEGARSEPESRRKAARVLESIADTSVATPLSQALRDPDLEVRRSAARALKRVSRCELCSDPERSADACDSAEIQGCERWAEERGGLR